MSEKIFFNLENKNNKEMFEFQDQIIKVNKVIK